MGRIELTGRPEQKLDDVLLAVRRAHRYRDHIGTLRIGKSLCVPEHCVTHIVVQKNGVPV